MIKRPKMGSFAIFAFKKQVAGGAVAMSSKQDRLEAWVACEDLAGGVLAGAPARHEEDHGRGGVDEGIFIPFEVRVSDLWG